MSKPRPLKWLSLSALPRELRLAAWGFVLLVIVLVLLVALTPPRPLTLVAASVRAETLKLTVYNPDEASFRVPAARVDRACVRNAIVRPDQGDTVTYTREVGGPLVIRVEGRVSWRSRTALLGKSGQGAYVRLDPADRACFAPAHVRLPVAGAMTIGLVGAGDAADESSMPVLSGQLTVYGRAVASVLGVSLQRLERLTLAQPQSLYLAETIALPAGSQIGRAFSGSRSGPEIARWWGFVDADLTPGGASERGLLIEASTNASALEILPPAPRVPSGETPPAASVADVITLTLGAQLAGDPNLRWLFGLAGGLIAVVSVLANVLTVVLPMYQTRPPGSEPAPVQASAAEAT